MQIIHSFYIIIPVADSASESASLNIPDINFCDLSQLTGTLTKLLDGNKSVERMYNIINNYIVIIV